MATPPPKSPAIRKAPVNDVDTAQETAVSTQQPQQWNLGLLWGVLSPIFLGIVPILAKVAYAAGVNVLTVVAFRTVIAAVFLWAGMAIFRKELIRSSLPAVLSSMIAGAINGLGSIFFYTSLTRIDASLGQLVNISYLVFVTVFLRLAGQTISLLTLFRTALTIGAIYLLTRGSAGPADWLGVGMMLFAAITYAVQLVLSQRIMMDIPAPTMTLYAITAMAVVVTIAWFFAPVDLRLVSSDGWQAIGLMALVTALSRLTLFLGVKAMGSIQTALLGVFEVVVTIAIAAVFLGERLTLLQWAGAAVLLASIFMVRFEKGVPRFIDWWQFLWRRYLPKK
ncbi:MAG: DMT family transporter [Ardenticatenaceae bacterium]|nr:DMT family transporter [Anaerolineales bacterium]MCB8940585.1 DMT family transporter [Ardenticatenaceae bacterium]MCB8971915.1 DMT family transporter [Ardenticatenaceae bacterium]